MNKLKVAIEFYHRKNFVSLELLIIASSCFEGLMMMIALHDLTVLDGADDLILPAVEVGEQADPPHVVGLGVALPLIVLFALLSSDLVSIVAELARSMVTRLKVTLPRMMMMTLSIESWRWRRRRRRMATLLMETLTTTTTKPSL